MNAQAPPWERLTDEAYKEWLLRAMTVDEYNGASVRDRRGLLSDFEREAEQRQRQHVNVAEGVFVLYRGDDNAAEPIGTAFAISPSLLLTACHNVVVKSKDGTADSTVLDLKVAPTLIRSPDGVIATEAKGRRVAVHKYNIEVDWAALVLDEDVDSFPLTSTIPLATHVSDIPSPGTSEKLYVYHCPLQLFLDDPEFERCHVMQKEASVGIIGVKTLTFQNGAFPGSCGGPYMFRNKAVALHTESTSTTKTAQNIKAEDSASGRKRKLQPDEINRMMVDSCVSSHTSLGSGIMLHVRSGIMALLK
jgi:hypothetical protein